MQASGRLIADNGLTELFQDASVLSRHHYIYLQTATQNGAVSKISDSIYPINPVIILHVYRPAITTGNPMKVQQNSRPTLHPAPNTQNTLPVQRSTINSVKPLLKASVTLPAFKSFDETGGYIKGYN